jgi:hypothetical protein
MSPGILLFLSTCWVNFKPSLCICGLVVIGISADTYAYTCVCTFTNGIKLKLKIMILHRSGSRFFVDLISAPVTTTCFGGTWIEKSGGTIASSCARNLAVSNTVKKICKIAGGDVRKE